MRAAFAALLLLLAPAALAQEDGGCTQADPCPWVFDVDENGISDDSGSDPTWTFTVGDWLILDVLNFDSEDHTISVDGHTWTIPKDFGDPEVTPFQFTSAGTYTVTDQPTGDTATVTVVEPAEEESGQNSSKGSPSVSVALLGIGLLLLARRP